MQPGSVNTETPIRYLRGVGPKIAFGLKKLDIQTVGNLLLHFPSRYRDFSKIKKISQLQPGETATIFGKIEKIKNIYTAGGKVIQKGVLKDSSGRINLLWFNQPFLAKTIRKNTVLSCSGKIELSLGQKILISPDYEPATDESLHTGRLVPVYPETKKISSKTLRKLSHLALDLVGNQLEETLPKTVLAKHNLPSRRHSFLDIHFPKTLNSARKARQRFAFEEMLTIQIKALRQKENWKKGRTAPKMIIKKKQIGLMIKKLPFALTSGQKRSVKEVLSDMEKSVPMNRLLQGDVGSGKTIPAIIAAYNAFLNGWPTAFMVPTQILAIQHYQTLKKLLLPLGVKIKLLTKDKKIKKTSPPADLVIGTHALIHQKTSPASFGLVIIDEQHRFGVSQRARLIKKTSPKAKASPHLLTMTATPIPRTVTLTLRGDLSLSTIDQIPAGRKKTDTFVVPDKKRPDAYRWIKKQIQTHHCQAFIICPFIEPSETLKTVKSAKEEFDKLQKQVFPNLALELLHGKISGRQKEKILKKMQRGKIDVLVATPVVEVGIDIPNATIMVIESAQRFGLAQLHQLRGRVGRGEKKSYCLLFVGATGNNSLKRLRAMEKINQGTKLAETDLRLRGPGDVYGLKQHGFPQLKAASILDLALIKKCRREAEAIIRRDPGLKKHPRLRKLVDKNSLVAPN